MSKMNIKTWQEAAKQYLRQRIVSNALRDNEKEVSRIMADFALYQQQREELLVNARPPQGPVSRSKELCDGENFLECPEWLSTEHGCSQCPIYYMFEE